VYRRAFSLIELLLVLALLLVAAALSGPSLARAYERHQLQQAVALVRTRLAAAHYEALRRETIYEFRYEPGGNRWLIVPVAADAGAPAPTGAWDHAGGYLGELPGRTRFHKPPGTATGRLDRHVAGLPIPDVAWSAPLRFFPDGTADGADLAIVGSRGDAQQLRVRRLTSGVTVRPLRGKP
jgi:prepilin-type N-terminal cleavage/methylation domain-containing protein